MLNSALNQERKQSLLKSRLIALFSHDFRNPLTTILMSSSVIRTYAERLPPVRKQQALNRIDGAVHSLTQMLDDMLIIAELESGYLAYKPEPIALAPFIEAIVAEYRLIDQNAHKLTFQHELQRPTQVDPKLLRQLLSNLIANALNYSPAGSEVTITVTEGVDTFTLSIQDQGIGIPAESLPYLFEPLYRADNAKHIRGTGLGLSIVKNCVDRHCGSIKVASELNQGTNFSIELPLIAK
jgi:signal transduction histidine kinase